MTHINYSPSQAASTVLQSSESTTIKTKKKRQRCSHSECKTKLTMIDLGIECKCGLSYCSRHRLPEDHQCSYDHGKEEADMISKKLKESACVSNKIIPV